MTVASIEVTIERLKRAAPLSPRRADRRRSVVILGKADGDELRAGGGLRRPRAAGAARRQDPVCLWAGLSTLKLARTLGASASGLAKAAIRRAACRGRPASRRTRRRMRRRAHELQLNTPRACNSTRDSALHPYRGLLGFRRRARSNQVRVPRCVAINRWCSASGFTVVPPPLLRARRAPVRAPARAGSSSLERTNEPS
jgi:hypothetical protein